MDDDTTEPRMLRKLLKINPLQIVLVVVGAGLLLGGIVVWWKSRIPSNNVIVEVVGDEVGNNDSNNGDVVVDVSGAVVQPGVYRFRQGSRLGEVIERAGGFTEDVDQGWVSKNINLAQVVIDGSKVYIPRVSEIKGVEDVIDNVAGSVDVESMININTASMEELDSLWGIGDVRAQAIIEHRPYGDIDELVTKAGVPENVFSEIKNAVTVY